MNDTINSNFRKLLLKEDVPPQRYPSPGNAEVGLTTDEENAFLVQINTVLEGLTGSPATNPYYMIQRIKDRLQLATGLTFDDGYLISDSGVIEKTLAPIDHTHAHKFQPLAKTIIDNGFLAKFRSGLKIRFTYLKSGPLYVISAQVLTTTPIAPAIVSEA